MVELRGFEPLTSGKRQGRQRVRVSGWAKTLSSSASPRIFCAMSRMNPAEIG